MADIPTITSPSDNSTQSLPFNVVGTGTPNSIVEARDDAGFLLPATANPVTVDAGGDFTIQVTGMTGSGTGNKWYTAAGGTVVAGSLTLDNSSAPWSAAVNNTAGSTLSRAFTVGGDVRTLVALVSFYTTQNDPYPVTLSWSGGTTPGPATAWVCRAWPVGTTGNTTTDFSGTPATQSTHDASIHWTTQIWTATWNGTPASATVIATRTGSDAFTGQLSVYSFGGAATSFGAIAQHHTPMSEVGGSNQLMQLTITPAYTDSWLVGIVHWGNATAALTEMASTIEDYSNGDAGEQGWSMAFHRSATTASTPVTVGVTNSQYAWAMCVLEVHLA